MNKKASSVLVMIFEVLAVLLIVTIAFKIAIGYANSDTITKINMAKDLGLMVNTLVSVPGDVVVTYPYNVSAYIILFDKNQEIIVMKKNDTPQNQARKKFYLPTHYSASGVLEEKERLCLEKRSTEIILRECSKEEFK